MNNQKALLAIALLAFTLCTKAQETVQNEIPATIKELITSMVTIEGGTFSMGATPEQGSDAEDDDLPAHKVTLSSYSIGRYEVTQEQWEAVMGSNPSQFKGAKLPVENVSWDDCQEFISRLNKMTGKKFRLPTEAEWEYAARGGKSSNQCKFSGSNDLQAVGWNYDNSGSATHPVGQKNPNELGLYDMSGNVWEWCSDRKGHYTNAAQTNPKGPSLGDTRIYRGGGWADDAACCRVAYRNNSFQNYKRNHLGLRLAM